jgi:nucleotide-binding universal stress UspA family protein
MRVETGGGAGTRLACVSGMIEIRRVLCPTDLSAVSEWALDYALDFARWYEADVTLLHVVPSLPVMLGATGVVPNPPTSGEAERCRAMEALVASRGSGGAPAIEAELTTGEPARQILARARQLRADLLVAGTRGRHGLPRWLLGSAAV